MTTLSDYANMSDQALTAYLFGLSVGCPLGLAKHECPLLELRDEPSTNVHCWNFAMTTCRPSMTC